MRISNEQYDVIEHNITKILELHDCFYRKIVGEGAMEVFEEQHEIARLDLLSKLLIKLVEHDGLLAD